jgi:NAD-dependent deacetylase
VADDAALPAAAAAQRQARRAVALSGAGIWVARGVPDFRSPDGLWSVFEPNDYATLDCFLREPERAWEFYRALGTTLAGKTFNPAHAALAELEHAGRLAGVITQNVDGFHQAAGSRTVVEMHGNHHELQCLACGGVEPLGPEALAPGPVPRCAGCASPLKPNAVLFQENVRDLDQAAILLKGCDLLLAIGTSAEVAPAALIPYRVVAAGGSVLEFNLEPTSLTREGLGPGGRLIAGPAIATLPALAALMATAPVAEAP